VNQGGAWKEQGLAKRLTMKQGGKYRREYFREKMSVPSRAFRQAVSKSLARNIAGLRFGE